MFLVNTYYVFKMKVWVNLEHLEEHKDFDLPNDALIGDLRTALSSSEGVVDPDERIRLYFKTTSGHDLGIPMIHIVQDNTF